VSSPVIEDCIFYDNTAYYGGGICLVNSSDTGTITGCVIRDNYAEARGGGLLSHNYRFDIIDSAVYANTCDSRGGGISVSEAEPALIRQCTLSRNSAPDGGGIQLQEGSAGVVIVCSIVSFNGTGGAFSLWEGTSIEVENCILWQNAGGDSIPPGGVDSGNNYVLDPQFCGLPGSGNLMLQSDSPCLLRNHPSGFLCARIGAYPAGCGNVGTDTRSWGDIRRMFRK
jgi:hypothetical protein